MHKTNTILLRCTFIFAMLTSIHLPATAQSQSLLPEKSDKFSHPGTHVKSEHVIVGYIFTGGEDIDPDAIAADKLTHINYAFSRIVDGRVVEGFANDEENYKKLHTLKAVNPKLRILSSVGGWTWSDTFSDMASTEEGRDLFVTSAVQFIQKHRLDGIDIDWEYPGLPGAGNTYRPEDGSNFTLLLSALRNKLDELQKQAGRPLIMTIASGGFRDFIAKSDIGNWHRYLTFINIMAYDFHVANDNNKTGHHAGLFLNPLDPSALSADSAVRLHIEAGVPRHKIVLGVPFYGRSWMQVSATDNGLFQHGRINRHDYGGDSFENISSNLLDDPEYKRYWDPHAQVPYLWNDAKQVFISYEDETSVTRKAQYVREEKLRGMMFWAYHNDPQGRLLNIMRKVLSSEDKNR